MIRRFREVKGIREIKSPELMEKHANHVQVDDANRIGFDDWDQQLEALNNAPLEDTVSTQMEIHESNNENSSYFDDDWNENLPSIDNTPLDDSNSDETEIDDINKVGFDDDCYDDINNKPLIDPYYDEDESRLRFKLITPTF